MRLGDMNNLKAEALNEDMQKRVGWNFGDLNRLTVNQASAMLENVDGKISNFKRTKQIHESERDTTYNGLLMAKQVLESYIAERAVSKSQQKAAGAALAAKRGDAPKGKLKGASKAMAKMSTKELEKVAGTKHKGLPEKVKENKERAYVAVHVKKGTTNVTADSSYGAAKKAADKWKLKSTAGIDVKLADVKHTATESVNKSKRSRVKTNESVEAPNQKGEKSDFFKKYATFSKSEWDKRQKERAAKLNRAQIDKPGKPSRSREWGAYESVNEGYSASEQAVDDTFNAVMDRLLSMAKIMREDGALAKNVDAIGGDSTFMRDAYRSMHSAYDKVADAHQGALGHVMHTDESASQGMFEDEVGQAETIMAAQDMVDSIQGMLEDVGQMVNEKLPPLTDSIRRSNGAEAAATFNQQTNDALNALMDAVRTARESMATAVGTLSGEAPAPMTSVDSAPAADADAGFDTELDAGDEFDDFGASDAAVGGNEPLGRSKRA